MHARVGSHDFVRWLREWLASQAAAGVLEWTDAPDGEMRYSVAPEMCEILLDDKSPNYQGGFVAMSESVLAALPAAEKSFTTGLGYVVPIPRVAKRECVD